VTSQKINRKIFISHSAGDSAVAYKLAHALASHGWTALSDESIAPGANFADEIGRRLRSASMFLVLVSEEALVSPTLNFEVGAALGQNKPVFAVFLSRHARNKAHSPLTQASAIMAEGLSPSAIANEVVKAVKAAA
jgi:hypothetical protein